MSIPVSQLANSQTMGTWYIRQNQLLSLMSSNVVTVDLTANGSLSVGNAAITGGLGATTIAANTLIGGTLSSPNTLFISSNVVYGNGIFQVAAFSANSTGGFANVNGVLTFTPASSIIGNIIFSNNVNVNNALTSNTLLAASLTVNNATILGSNTVTGSALSVSSSQTAVNAYSTNGVAGQFISNNGVAGQFISNTGNPLYVGNTTGVFFEVFANGVTFANNLMINTFNSGGLTIGNTVFTVNSVVTGNAYFNNMFANNGYVQQNLAITGNVAPTTNNVSLLGTPTSFWNAGYISSITANTIALGTGSINSTSYTGAANNATYFGGQLPSYYPNNTIYVGAFNGTTIVASGGANVTGTIYGNNGIFVTNYNANSQGQVVLLGGTYSTILRNDGVNFSVLSTASGNTNGTWNAFRPFIYNLVSGNVNIDQTGSGVTFGGNINAISGTIGTLNANVINVLSNSSNGINVSSNTGSGISSLSNTLYGVIGSSVSNNGIIGISNSGSGVVGQSNVGYGIKALSTSANVAYFGNTTTQFVNIDNTGNLNSAFNVNANNVYAPIHYAGNNTNGVLGYSSLNQGNSTATGYVAFYNNSEVRAGYIGSALSGGYINLETENGYLGYNVTGNLTVAGNTTISGNTTVTGNTFLNSNLTVNNNVTINGALQAAVLSTLAISSNTNLANSNLGQVLVANSANAITIYVSPSIASGRLMVTRLGANTVTLVSNTANPVTLVSRTGNYSVLNQYGSISIFFATSNTVVVDGNI